MTAQHISWQEKLTNTKGLPKVVRMTGKMTEKWGKGTMIIPAPKEVDALMKRVPRGKLITINEIRQQLAAKHHTTIACPLTTGIFAWIAAHAAEEAKAEDKENATSYWRTLKTGGFINERYPGGVEVQKKLLEKEGHTIVKKGKKYVIVDFEKHLIS